MSLIMIIILLLAIAAGIPVAFGLSFASIATLFINGLPFTVFTQNFSLGVNSFSLLAIPFFILAGKLMNSAGITTRIFRFVNYFVGPFRGGLGQVNIISSLIFAGMSGAATADAAGLGMIELKAMKDAGYDDDFSVAITAASATVGPIIPPSIIMVVYGITAEVSIGRLFIGGIIPGILMTLTLMIITYIIAVKRDYPREEKVPFRVIASSFFSALPALLAPLVIIGGILGGIFTATEAGAVTVLYALFIGTFIYKELTFKRFFEVLLDSMVTTSIVLVIIGSAKVFGWILTYYQIPAIAAQQLISLTQNPLAITSLLVILYLFLGCFMESAAIVVMTVPVIIPILNTVGIDPIFFGVIVAVCMSIGTLTPPLGIVMYVLCDIGNVPIDRYFKVILPYLAALIGVIFLLVLMPDIVTFLPNIFLE